jgi:hypothetical protein
MRSVGGKATRTLTPTSKNTPKRPPDWVLNRIEQRLSYAPDTGVVSWKTSPAKHIKPGARAGGIKRSGSGIYRVIGFDNCEEHATCYEHHVVYFLMTREWPVFQIDHRDGDGGNNKWENLRLATESQQRMNSRLSSRNRSGFKGVCYHKCAKKYHAQIGVNRQHINLGYFSTIEAAANAYEAAAKIYHDQEYRKKP